MAKTVSLKINNVGSYGEPLPEGSVYYEMASDNGARVGGLMPQRIFDQILEDVNLSNTVMMELPAIKAGGNGHK